MYAVDVILIDPSQRLLSPGFFGEHLLKILLPIMVLQFGEHLCPICQNTF